MRKWKTSFVFACVAVLILAFNACTLFHLGYSRQSEEDFPFPKSGTWQCQELGITLFLDEGKCIVSDNKDIIECYVLRERGTPEVYICCNELDNPDYKFDQIFFSGDFLDTEGNAFYVQAHKSETVYTFYQVIE